MMPTLTIIWHSFGSPGHNNQIRRRNKGFQIGKEGKLSLFTDDMILYTENPKDAIRKLLELINEFGKIEGYTTNTQKSVAILHINRESSEREIKEISKDQKEKLWKQFHLLSHQKE